MLFKLQIGANSFLLKNIPCRSEDGTSLLQVLQRRGSRRHRTDDAGGQLRRRLLYETDGQEMRRIGRRATEGTRRLAAERQLMDGAWQIINAERCLDPPCTNCVVTVEDAGGARARMRLVPNAVA